MVKELKTGVDIGDSPQFGTRGQSYPFSKACSLPNILGESPISAPYFALFPLRRRLIRVSRASPSGNAAHTRRSARRNHAGAISSRWEPLPAGTCEGVPRAGHGRTVRCRTTTGVYPPAGSTPLSVARRRRCVDSVGSPRRPAPPRGHGRRRVPDHNRPWPSAHGPSVIQAILHSGRGGLEPTPSASRRFLVDSRPAFFYPPSGFFKRNYHSCRWTPFISY